MVRGLVQVTAVRAVMRCRSKLRAGRHSLDTSCWPQLRARSWMNILSKQIVLLGLVVTPWLFLLLSALGERGGDPWQLLDSQNRQRARVEEGADGSFDLVFLDAFGERKLVLGTAGDGSPTVRVTKGASVLRICPEGAAGDLALSVEGASTKALVTRFGVAVFDANKAVRAALNLSDDMQQAECFVNGRGGRVVGLSASEKAASVAFAGQMAGIEVSEGKQRMWLGTPATTGRDYLNEADGIGLIHVDGESLVTLKGGSDSRRVFLQASGKTGTGIQVGDKGVDPRLRFGLASGEGKLPYIESLDKDGAVLWRFPAEAK